MAAISGHTDGRDTTEYWFNGVSDYQIDLKRKDGVWGVALNLQLRQSILFERVKFVHSIN